MSKKWKSRKFIYSGILGTAFFVCAQILKFGSKIEDVWWFFASIGAVVGYAAVLRIAGKGILK